MSDSNDPFVAALHALVPTIVPGASRIAGLRRLSAGATLETWSFDATGDTASDTGEPRPLRHPLQDVQRHIHEQTCTDFRNYLRCFAAFAQRLEVQPLFG